jgi:hypothetical protein
LRNDRSEKSFCFEAAVWPAEIAMNEMPRKTVNSQRARQGGTGSRVLLILVASLVLLGVVWLVSELFGEASETPATRDQPAGLSPSVAPSSD